MYMQVRMPLACFFVLLYTFLLHCLKKRLHTMTSRVYEIMGLFGLVHEIAAVITEYTVNNRDEVPYLYNHIWHIIFLVSITLVCAFMYLYLILYVERGLGRPKVHTKRLLALVTTISIIGELVLPITYIDSPYGSYSLGPKAYALYLTVVYVMVMLVCTTIRYRKVLAREKTYTLMSSVALFVIISCIQIRWPYILLTDLGVCLVLLGLTVNSEDVHMYVSNDTGLYNEQGCREILQEVVIRGKPFTVAAYAFMGEDTAVEQAMLSVQQALPERDYNVICGALADNLLLIVPLYSATGTRDLRDLPEPQCPPGVSYTSETHRFTEMVTVDHIIDIARDFKTRFEDNQLQRDELTGLLRRTAFMRQVDGRIMAGTAFTFLMVDIDRFKQVNDCYGHSVGDELLQRVALALEGQLRGSDVVCRMGGDEFGIILANVTTHDDVVIVAERLRSAAASIQLNSASFPISLSVGAKISLPQDEGRTFQRIYTEADAALYDAKDAGKNRLCFSKT